MNIIWSMHDPRERSPGTLVVSAERWRDAQAWESELWRTAWAHGRKSRLSQLLAATGLGRVFPALKKIAGNGDDWNRWWRERFDGYRLLPKDIGNAIELGCGPFTNIRLIKEGRSIARIVCSDPLANDYVQLRGAWLAEAHRKGEVEVDQSPAEDILFESGFFDLVVMINVLDHVRDMPACVETAIRLTRPEGHLVLGQDLTSAEDAARIGDDLGHPIRITHSDLDELLLDRLEPSLRRVLPREEGRNPDAHYGTYLVIGSKREPESH